jgi:hypothetical protein
LVAPPFGGATCLWSRIPIVKTDRLPIVGHRRPVDFEEKADQLALALPVISPIA